jgi:hypothetical protein
VSEPGFARDLDDVRNRIRQARKSGLITKREARQLRRETYVLERHAATYSRGGYSDSEREELNARSRYLSDAVFRTVK